MLNKTYYKVLRKNRKDDNYQYVIGFNKSHEKFNLMEEFLCGGLSFCDLDHVPLYLWDDMYYVCEIKLCATSQIYVCDYEYITDKLFLSKPIPISDFLKNHKIQKVFPDQVEPLVVLHQMSAEEYRSHLLVVRLNDRLH